MELGKRYKRKSKRKRKGENLHSAFHVIVAARSPLTRFGPQNMFLDQDKYKTTAKLSLHHAGYFHPRGVLLVIIE